MKLMRVMADPSRPPDSGQLSAPLVHKAPRFPSLQNVGFTFLSPFSSSGQTSNIYDKPPQITWIAGYPYCVYLDLFWFISSFE